MILSWTVTVRLSEGPAWPPLEEPVPSKSPLVILQKIILTLV